MLSTLEQLDHSFLLAINGAHAPFLDAVMVWISKKTSWIALYIVIAGYAVWKHQWKAVWIVLGGILTIALTDSISTQLIKDSVQRYRPCHHLLLKDSLHLVNGKCGGLYGFVSSHAANTMGLTVFILFSRLGSWRRKEPFAGILATIMLLYALLNSYSRVYLGQHYPSDVIGGMMLGFLTGSITGWLAYRWLLKSRV